MARQQFVRLGESRGDFVAVADGVKSGQVIVTAGAFKLRNNAGIVVNNDIKVEPQLAPKPENR
jgi:membrane fusion protein (multidrug efflux system)